MGNRKKRLEKGIESIRKEIEEHKLKEEKAIKEGKFELARYYTAEITGLEKSKDRKERKIK